VRGTAGDAPPALLAGALLGLGAIFAVTPWATPASALALGIALALLAGNPFASAASRAARWLLQIAVVGIGFGVPWRLVIAAGLSGVCITGLGIATTLALGMLLGRSLRVEWEASFLITAGTSICGGSAIAAVGPAIGARPEAMSVALGTVFALNAVALYLFPPIGHLLHFSQHQFALWAALAIHDTSSVVGAASHYGTQALQEATVLKLARTLWIIPLSAAAATLAHRRGRAGGARWRVRIPWFIGWFVLAALARAVAASAAPAFDLMAHAARVALVLTLFLVGSCLTRDSLRAIGVRPLVQGAALWLVVTGITLYVVAWRAGA
jgi:uncharacterized integral membrane protein (TIGR00698 family)